jgi:hypothetical protein
MTGPPATSTEPDLPAVLVEGTLWFALVSGALLVVTLSALSSLMLAHTLHQVVHLPEPSEASVQAPCPGS